MEFKEIDQNNLIYIFNQNQLKKSDFKNLIIVKDKSQVPSIDNCVIMNYQDDFESLLNFSLPTKMRKTKQLLSLSECQEIMAKINYGVLSFSYQDLPYSVGLNHIIYDGRIFFHCAKSGFKLNSINQRSTFLIVEDLGINDTATKKAALLQIVADLAPKHPYNDKMLEFTNILELDVDYIIGKSHIR